MYGDTAFCSEGYFVSGIWRSIINFIILIVGTDKALCFGIKNMWWNLEKKNHTALFTKLQWLRKDSSVHMIKTSIYNKKYNETQYFEKASKRKML